MANPVNPQPKARFLSEGANTIKAHRDLMDNPNLQHSIDVALLQYQANLCGDRATDAMSVAACHFKMVGALQFIHMLKNLSENPPEPPKRQDPDNLEQ